MIDLSSITTALSAVKGAAEIAKLLKDTGDSLQQAELKLKLADLIEKLAETKISLADIRLTIETKDAQIATLQSKLEDKEALFYQAPYYVKIGANGEKDGPFCQHCYDTAQKIIRLQEGRTGSWACHSCKNGVQDATYTPPKPISRSPRGSWNRPIY